MSWQLQDCKTATNSVNPTIRTASGHDTYRSILCLALGKQKHSQPSSRQHLPILRHVETYICKFLICFVNRNITRMGPTFKLWRPSRRASGESWGDSRGDIMEYWGLRPQYSVMGPPRIPPRFLRRPPGRPPKLKCGAHPGPLNK